MLPAAYRLTRRQDFTQVVRRGRRAGRRRLVVHALITEGVAQDRVDGGSVAALVGSVEVSTAGDTPTRDTHRATTSSTPTRDALHCPRVGFVVSKAVGGSVVRHQVARRLRHLMRDRLVELPDGSDVVVRALAPAATASSAELGADLDAALRRLVPASRLVGGETG